MENPPILFTDLLMWRNAEFAAAVEKGRVKMARHVFGPERKEIRRWIGNNPDRFNVWQGCQKAARRQFDDCLFIVSLMAAPPGRGRFVGVYRNKSKDNPLPIAEAAGNNELLAGLQSVMPADPEHPLCFYKLQKMTAFSSLADRVIIRWNSPRNWMRRLTVDNPPEVLEILAKDKADRAARPFPGMASVLISFDEMARMVNSPIAYGDWHAALKSSKGVYLITEKDTGKMYVGAAYNDNGILGRWKKYAKKLHGYSKKLEARLKDNPNAYHNWEFSILQQLPQVTIGDDAIECEEEWKAKLRTREYGYN